MAFPIMQISEQLALEYQIAATTSATSALALAYLPDSGGGVATGQQTVLVTAVSADITFNFGGATVAASTTVDGSLKTLPVGNFTVASGKTYSIRLNAPTQNYVSVKTATGSGTAIINLTRPMV